MGGSVGSSKSDSGSSNQFKQEVFGPQAEALSGLYSGVGDAFNSVMGSGKGGKGSTPLDQVSQGANFNTNVMNQAMPAWQNQLQGGAYQDLGIGGDLMSSLNQSLSNPTATQGIYSSVMGGEGNDYVDAMRGQFTQDASDALDLTLGKLDQRAAGNQMGGGSRHGVATALGARDINKALTGNLANLGYETFDKDLQNKLNIANQADANTLQRQQLMANMLGGQQQVMNQGMSQLPAMYGTGMSQQMMPWQHAGQVSNIFGAPTVLSSGSGSSSSDSKGFGASGGK